jgi:hypothetical protein
VPDTINFRDLNRKEFLLILSPAPIGEIIMCNTYRKYYLFHQTQVFINSYYKGSSYIRSSVVPRCDLHYIVVSVLIY